jgi:hypothetical protein
MTAIHARNEAREPIYDTWGAVPACPGSRDVPEMQSAPPSQGWARSGSQWMCITTTRNEMNLLQDTPSRNDSQSRLHPAPVSALTYGHRTSDDKRFTGMSTDFVDMGHLVAVQEHRDVNHRPV